MAVGLASAMLRTLLRQCVYRCAARQKAGVQVVEEASTRWLAQWLKAAMVSACLLLPGRPSGPWA